MTPYEPSFPAQRPMLIGLGALTFLLAVLVGWGVWARIDGAVILTGQIEIDQNHQIIQHPEGGVVAELAIREGDQVKAGDILLRLQDLSLAPEIASLSARKDEVTARAARLEAARDGANSLRLPGPLRARQRHEPNLAAIIDAQQILLSAEVESTARQVDQLGLQAAQVSAQLGAIRAQLSALDDLAALLSQETAQQRSLTQKGLSSAQALGALQREAAQLAANRAKLWGAEAEAAERMAEIALRAEEVKSQRRREALAELRDLHPLLYDLTAKLEALEARQAALTLRAPVAGQVYGLKIFAAQSVIRPAEPIASLIPEGRDLVIGALVPAVAIDRVHLGQSVRLRLPGLAAEDVPQLLARVVRLSGDTFADERLGAVYRAEMRLLPHEINRLPPGITLLPGMPVEAYLSTGSRTPMAYLVSPLTRYFSRAFRQG